MTHPIPDEALNSHIAILGKTGSGKSNAAKTIVEAQLDRDERVCIIDPTGSWYGLRLKADGSPSGYPVVIFGGQHGDKQIGGRHGGAIAEVVATSSTPAVIDTRLMSVGERTTFFKDFAETLLRRNRGPLRLVIDEAHLFAPQSGGAGGKDIARNEMLHAANNLVSLGRSIGLRIVLISQRPAKLHKDSLTQVETLVAMRLIHNLDVAAVKAWIGEWADPSQGKEIVESLPSLPTGDAWVWSPEIGVLTRAHFPLAGTYDSGKAPSGDEAGPNLQPINLDRIDAMLDKTAADIKANDPRALNAEVARLTRELAAAQRGGEPTWPDQRKDVEALNLANTALEGALKRAGVLVGQMDGLLLDLHKALTEISIPIPAPSGGAPAPARRERATPPKVAPRPEGGVASTGINGPQQRVLDAIAWWNALGISDPKNEQVSFIAGYAPSTSAYKSPKSAARSAGLIEYPASGTLRLTDAGAALANMPDSAPSVEELHRRVIGRLSGPQRRVLEPALAAYPEAMSNDELAAAAGYAPSTSAYKSPKSSLKRLTLLTYPHTGTIRAADWLFPRPESPQ